MEMPSCFDVTSLRFALILFNITTLTIVQALISFMHDCIEKTSLNIFL